MSELSDDELSDEMPDDLREFLEDTMTSPEFLAESIMIEVDWALEDEGLELSEEGRENLSEWVLTEIIEHEKRKDRYE